MLRVQYKLKSIDSISGKMLTTKELDFLYIKEKILFTEMNLQ